ncbi:hypothetical protein I302_105396 [Kwoniella bestiolae CBS 10118]|uniref:Uncharacterized protein n=1 Tax=Kwoniella bestiolae CBS 10118 TaxID=1296100 RepID=A0A1B9FT06_9TREE|nr:hypothetical protein I302_08677 [Kwoniella bestiolae CBS 10118]OCF21898.1 hypothetical protein I302_08677 [Kwoniella bestiolae CBS 10118]
MTNHHSPSSPLPKRPRPPSSRPSHSSTSHPPTKRSKLDSPISDLVSTLVSLSHTTFKAHTQAITAQQQFDTLRTIQPDLERENKLSRESLAKSCVSHQQVTKDLKIAQGSARRLRSENDVLHRKYGKVKRERDDIKQDMEKLKAKLEQQVQGHPEKTTSVVSLREEMNWMVEQHRFEVNRFKEELEDREKLIASTEKENKYLIRKMVELEDELDSVRTSALEKGSRSKEHRRDLEELWSIIRGEYEGSEGMSGGVADPWHSVLLGFRLERWWT